MPRVKTTPPSPSREKGQRSLDLPLYITRYIPFYGRKEWLQANTWRQLVLRQPVATICRETLIANVVALDWKIEPRDSTQRDEYSDEIEYYTRLFEDTGSYDYVELIEWVLADLLDIPFGGAVETIREGDSPTGRVLDIIPIDGATLFPTLNANHPVGQTITELHKTIYFPDHAINRIMYSPRREIKKEGWSMAPPELIYLSLELINRGDMYYANLLLDTPAAGILDLGDMAKDSAEEWVTAWREMLGGTDPFKIPVLYEHEKNVQWIPFTRNPTELMFDKATLKYASFVAAGYGMSLSDIGVSATSSGGDTLAGSIRQERKTKRTGLARLKKKTVLWFNRMLPEYLRFNFIDMDDELNVALGRARLANSTAWSQYVTSGMFTPEEARQQTIADGLLTISVPEKLPEGAFPVVGGEANERPNELGRPVAPSDGGHGEVFPRSDILSRALYDTIHKDDLQISRLAYAVFPIVRIEVEAITEEVDVYDWMNWHNEAIFGERKADISNLTDVTISSSLNIINKSLKEPLMVIDKDKVVAEIKDFINSTSSIAYEQNQKRLYIKGDTDEIKDTPDKFDVDEKLLSGLVDEFVTESERGLRSAIVSGVYSFAIHNTQLDNLDEVPPSLVSYIRTAMEDISNYILTKFGGKISDIILENL